MKENWKTMIQQLTIETNDDYCNLKCTLTPDELDAYFTTNGPEIAGAPFTAWSEDYVYFPACHDGHEWVECVPRNPCDKSMFHVGQYE